MKRHIPALAVVAVVTVAIGCAGAGEEQNYKELDEQRPLFEPENPNPPTSRAPQTIPLAAAVQEDAAATQPAAKVYVFTLRQQWPSITVGPADGRTRHNPVYFRDFPLDDTYVDVTDPSLTQSRFDAALNGADARNWHIRNALGAAAQPAKFGIDLMLLPVYQVTEGWPWAPKTTP